MKQPIHKTPMQYHIKNVWSYPFPFTGKERDKETGYGYFGARYMDHELTTMWLSVDPMSDKYPGISPYAYCAWNPVKLVDPDGRDWYDVDKNGYIRRNKTKSELYPDYDIIYSSHTGKEMIINDKSLLKQLSLSRNDVPKYSNHINYVSSQNKEIGSLFLFLSDNTDVEWGLSGFRLPNKKEYVLTTLHSNQGTFSGSEIRNNECNMQNMIFDIHSHPGKNAVKGASDHDMKTFMERSKYPQAPYPIHYVYHQYTKNLYHYNSSNNCIFIRKIERSSGIDYILNFR